MQNTKLPLNSMKKKNYKTTQMIVAALFGVHSIAFMETMCHVLHIHIQMFQSLRDMHNYIIHTRTMLNRRVPHFFSSFYHFLHFNVVSFFGFAVLSSLFSSFFIAFITIIN